MPQNGLPIESLLQFFLQDVEVVCIVLAGMLSCALDYVAVGEHFPSQKCLLDGLILNEIDMLEQILKIVGPR